MQVTHRLPMIGILLSLKPFQEICMYAKITSMFDNRKKNLQNKPCLLISSTPPNFFLKSTAIPFPILTSSLIQCAKEWEVGQENRSPLFSSNLKPCQTNITVVYLHSYITIVCFLYTFIKTINNSNMCGIVILYT